LGLSIVPVNNKTKILRVLIILQLLLDPLLTANLGAQDHGIPMPTPPTLPATSEENWTVKRFRLDHPALIYDTWTAKRNKIGNLARGAIVSGLLKLSVVYKPDIVTITAPMPQFGLNVGDTILRYTYEGEGFADFWIKGRWYKELDGSFLTEQDGNGCSKNCSGKVTQLGQKEEWSHIRLQDGRDAWFRSY
jgi:hypothetical protein